MFFRNNQQDTPPTLNCHTPDLTITRSARVCNGVSIEIGVSIPSFLGIILSTCCTINSGIFNPELIAQLIKSIKLFNNNARNLLTMIKSKNDLKIITTKLTKYVLSEHMKRYGNINENLTFNNESQNTIDNNLTSNTVTPIFNNEIQELLKNNSNTILHNENIVMFNENILDNEYSLNVGDNDYLWL